MENFASTIRAYQGVLTGFVFDEPASFPEDFAIKRFLKKMERPDSSRASERSQRCWDEYKAFDKSLPMNLVMPLAEWYKARVDLHKSLRSFKFRWALCDFPQGSEFFSTRGRNSLESRLSSSLWSVTKDNFENFARLAYNHKSLKRAVRRRYLRWYQKSDFPESLRSSNRLLYNRFKHKSNFDYEIFKWKLERIVVFVEGSRFSTVPKNNNDDRPINIEPFGNIMVQRGIGGELRRTLEEYYGQDLDNLAEKHRLLISDPQWATIDLKNASDSVTIALCRFLLPARIFSLLMSSRSPFLYGPDRNYHQTRKISSMGNGFTFELMTLILTSLCRVLDSESSVFGDDIIIKKEHSGRLICLLESVGFVVNKEKSFTSGPFRESCGGNFHDEHGYIESYDFKYPHTIHDCVIVYNKAKYLSSLYPSFSKLERALYRFIPKALHGGPFQRLEFQPEGHGLADRSFSTPDNRPLSSYFMTGTEGVRRPKYERARRRIAKNYQLPLSKVAPFMGFKWVPKLRTPTASHLRPHYHWAKYEMYLASGRKCPDELTGEGSWTLTTYWNISGHATRRDPNK